MLAVPRCSGGLVRNISGSMGRDCGALRRRHSAEKAVPFPSAARRPLNRLYTGVVHERDLSIKQDEECAEPAGGSRACSATKRRFEWTCFETQRSEST